MRVYPITPAQRIKLFCRLIDVGFSRSAAPLTKRLAANAIANLSTPVAKALSKARHRHYFPPFLNRTPSSMDSTPARSRRYHQAGKRP